MIEALERPTTLAPSTGRDAAAERTARRALSAQIERLERDLAGLFAASWPRKGIEWRAGAHASTGTPRLLDLGELERVRDALVLRVEDARRDLADRKQVETANRRLIEAMLREPERYPWVRVSHEDIGEPGCRHWHVVPRWGLLGRLAGWWRVKISSGCPLPGRPSPDCPQGRRCTSMKVPSFSTFMNVQSISQRKWVSTGPIGASRCWKVWSSEAPVS